MKKIYTASDMEDAIRIRNLLASVGIKAEMQGEYLWGSQQNAPREADVSPSIWVPKNEAESALELVERDSDDDEPMTNWKCAHCGETSEGAFTTCWHCGKSRS